MLKHESSLVLQLNPVANLVAQPRPRPRPQAWARAMGLGLGPEPDVSIDFVIDFVVDSIDFVIDSMDSMFVRGFDFTVESVDCRFQTLAGQLCGQSWTRQAILDRGPMDSGGANESSMSAWDKSSVGAVGQGHGRPIRP